LPLIGISELRKFFKLKPDFCILKARVVEAENFPRLPFKEGQWGASLDLAITFAFTYRSIFEQKYITNTLLSVIAAKRDALVPPGPKDGPSYLRCLD